ncbi:MAG: wax ester/triacylglycerol synthase family O-acyltransferase [Solirubrobacterales bacterium]|nr:wax ester/triacylglycerol synthase family O-acyltransferase [Solirubrobacterales bacterium]HMT05223.1 wax ester/triacylglycerol synthase family O-acyltransferase [Solirubrobacterales bacterium]
MEPASHELDRLTAIDAQFLTNESENSHMHIGAVMIFDGDPPTYDEFKAHIGSRLDFVPRYRQKLVYPPYGTGRPLWADDPDFNLNYHLRHTALPKPGGERELKILASRLFSQALDRSKPLWEMFLVEELDGDRFAIIIKSHHAMIDGISGVDIGTVIFDVTPDAEAIVPEQEWKPKPLPSNFELLERGARELATEPVRLGEKAVSAFRKPSSLAGRVGESAEGLAEVARALADAAPDVPLNVPIGPHRRVTWTSASLDEFRRIKDAFGTTVNDVVLAISAGSIRKWLIKRGIDTDGLELRAMVPVSVRSDDERGQLGNKLATMRAPLPVYEPDPVARLEIVSASMDGLKQSKQALGAEVIARLNDFAPPTLLAQAARLTFSTRLFNLLVTNVPGPQIPLYVLGRKLSKPYPVAFLAKNHGLAVGVMSYAGKINVGLIGDFDAMPDIGQVRRGLNESLAELAEAAEEIENSIAPKKPASKNGAGTKRAARKSTSKS